MCNILRLALHQLLPCIPLEFLNRKRHLNPHLLGDNQLVDVLLLEIRTQTPGFRRHQRPRIHQGFPRLLVLVNQTLIILPLNAIRQQPRHLQNISMFLHHREQRPQLLFPSTALHDRPKHIIRLCFGLIQIRPDLAHAVLTFLLLVEERVRLHLHVDALDGALCGYEAVKVRFNEQLEGARFLRDGCREEVEAALELGGWCGRVHVAEESGWRKRLGRD